MSNGSIMELTSKNKLDEEIKNDNFFNYDIKNSTYSKGDLIFYPQGQINWGNTIRINIEKKGDLFGLTAAFRINFDER